MLLPPLVLFLARSRVVLQRPAGLLLVLALVGCAGVGEKESSGRKAGDLMHVSCLKTPETGRCDAPRAAFYYDWQTDACKPVARGVCDPNWPFRSLRDCVKACGGKSAP